MSQLKKRTPNKFIPQRVHLIFKTHLDLGFTDLARNVASTYAEQYIPHALRVAKELRNKGRPDRFVWTTGSWLIYEYLERASRAERAALERAIAERDIVWHGLPFTTHSELMDADLFRFGLSLSQELDSRFGVQTIAAKMTDVPGHTRGIVPLLSAAGIQFLHIGVNPSSTTPAVPPVFVWRAPNGAEVIVMYQKGAYGALQIVPGMDEAIAFAHTDDNRGPQSVDQVRAVFAQLRRQFRSAEIVASTMDAFALKLLAVKAQLPVVTQEIGDTWIHGAASDPKKVSQFRALLRARHSWLVQGIANSGPKAFKNFSRALLLVPEHTWGLDVKTHLHDSENYRGDLFRAARTKQNFQKMEASWQEQREYLDEAVKTLDDSVFSQGAREALNAVTPTRPRTAGYLRVVQPFKRFETSHWQFQFDRRGAMTYLVEKESGRVWATPDHPIGLFCYESFAQADYDRFYKQYIQHKPENAWWSVPDFTKPGMASARAIHRDWYLRVQALYASPTETRFLLGLHPPERAVVQYGCPASVWLEIEFPEQEPSIRFVVYWFDKPASRLPEAIWFSFCPLVRDAKGWTMDKLGQDVSPLDVIRDGNRHLHAVGQGVRYRDETLELDIETLDAPLVAPGERALLNFTNRQPLLKKGMHFLLYDNVWGTNFPMWYQDDGRFEFVFRQRMNKKSMEYENSVPAQLR